MVPETLPKIPLNLNADSSEAKALPSAAKVLASQMVPSEVLPPSSRLHSML